MKKNLKKIPVLIKGVYENGLSKITKKPAKLYGLFFEVTDACNSRCRHCNVWRQKPTENHLTLPEIENIFKNPFFRNLREVIISGGEPLLREDLEEIILKIHKYIRPDALISLSTNGLMPKRAIKVAQTFLKKRINIVFGVSLDGIGEKHDKIRGVKGNFEKVDFLLHELMKLKTNYKEKLKVIVGFTLSPLTVNLMEEVKTYVERLEFDFLPQVYEKASFYFNEENHLKNTINNDMVREIQKLPSSFQKEVLLKAARNVRIKFRCSSMNTFFVLHCNGDVSPCLRYSHIRLGNLREQSIDEIWQSKAVKEARMMIKNCSGCYNTWGVGWSLKAWFFPFLKLILKTTLKRK